MRTVDDAPRGWPDELADRHQVGVRVHRAAVAGVPLEVIVRPAGVAGGTDVADHVAGLHLAEFPVGGEVRVVHEPVRAANVDGVPTEPVVPGLGEPVERRDDGLTLRGHHVVALMDMRGRSRALRDRVPEPVRDIDRTLNRAIAEDAVGRDPGREIHPLGPQHEGAVTNRALELAEAQAELMTELRQVALVPAEAHAIRREGRALALHFHDACLDLPDLVVQVLPAHSPEIVKDLELPDRHLPLMERAANSVVRVRRHDQRSDDERGADGERHAACDELRTIQEPRPPR